VAKIDLKSFDWGSLKRYTSPKAADDLNRFLEKMPQHAGQTILIAAAIAWGMAAAAGLFTAIQAQKMTELREKLKETKALQPSVPKIKNVGIGKKDVENFVNKAKESYKGLDIRANGSTIIVTAKSTRNFTEFREAIGHVQNGGNGWRVSLEKLCVGRECDKQYKLAVSLKVNKVSVETPK